MLQIEIACLPEMNNNINSTIVSRLPDSSCLCPLLAAHLHEPGTASRECKDFLFTSEHRTCADCIARKTLTSIISYAQIKYIGATYQIIHNAPHVRGYL